MAERQLLDIKQVAQKIGIGEDNLYSYGKYMAKIEPETQILPSKAKLVLVTAMTPTKAGEGKTTISIALIDGLNAILAKENKVAVAALRQPSLGPVFGMKGGATGGGLASIEPAEDININFTGDIHALTAAHSLISAVLDNSLFQGNPLNIDPTRIVFPRALDMNDRALRKVIVGIDKKHPGGREETYVITAASELMAVFCLSRDVDDFKAKVGQIIVAFDKSGKPLTVKDLQITTAVLKIMKQALKPNLVQTLYGSPVLVHGGPFANIAHGCCSYIALKTALGHADYVISEAGFGAELGAEKFLDILCPRFALKPDCAVVIGTVNSLKLQGGVSYEDLSKENIPAALKGLGNLTKHLNNVKSYGLPVVCCLNKINLATVAEVQAVKQALEKEGFNVVECDSYTKGQEGGVALAQAVIKAADSQSDYAPLVKAGQDIKTAIETLAKRLYGAATIAYSPQAEADIQGINALAIKNLNVCVAKTPLSLTDDPRIPGTPAGFTLHIDRVKLSAGAGFAVAISGKTLLMPGLPSIPAAVTMEKEQ